MSFENVALKINKISKQYLVADSPRTRLLSLLAPSVFGNKVQKFNALSDISFEVRKGECFGLVGQNGAGKSTLLQIIAGVLNPSSGSVEVNGRISALLELGAGFNPEFSGIENIRLTGRLKGMSNKEIEEKIDEVVAFADIGQFIERPVKTYSSGMFMRVAFSANLMNQPDILIIDEALAVGDSNFQKKCISKFYEAKENGTTILFVSHDAYQVRKVCDRALLLDQGKLVALGHPDSVVDEYHYIQENKERSENVFEVNNSNVGEDIVITDVSLLDANSKEIDIVNSGDDIFIKARVKVSNRGHEKLSFVINLYRHDGLYICGTTTAMDGEGPYDVTSDMEITIKFPNFSLLSGRYTWRFAVNDAEGLGILTEATPVCDFKVVDGFEAVGLVNLKRQWSIG